MKSENVAKAISSFLKFSLGSLLVHITCRVASINANLLVSIDQTMQLEYSLNHQNSMHCAKQALDSFVVHGMIRMSMC